MNVLVFGATGLLGTTLCQALHLAGHTVHRFGRDAGHPCRSEEEISQAFAQAMQRVQPDCVVNLIAATNVDACEQSMGEAALLNCFVPQVLARLCRQSAAGSCHLLHLSSDQVYDGPGPHTEGKTSPVNVYALTKLIGEYAVLQSGGCVVRTNFFGRSRSSKRVSFSDWLVHAAQKASPLNVFEDVFFSPLGLDSLSHALIRSLDIRLTGLYNLGSNAAGVSKAEFARLLFVRLGLDCSVLRATRVQSAQLSAPRPKDMRMDSSLFAAAAAFPIPTIEQEINHEASHYTQP